MPSLSCSASCERLDVDRVGLQVNFAGEFLIARLRIPTVDQNSRVGRMKPDQIDTDIERLQIDVGVDLVEARIDAPVHTVVADSLRAHR